MGIAKGTDPSARHSLQHVYDPVTQEWEAVQDGIFRDTDITITWTGGKPTTIEIVNSLRTKTMTLSWTTDQLDSIAVVVT